MKRFAFLFLLAGWLVPLASAQETEHFQFGVNADYLRLSQTDTNFAGVGARLGFLAFRNIKLEAELNYDFDQAFTEGFTTNSSGSVGIHRTGMRILHGEFGPKVNLGEHWHIHPFVQLKGGFMNFHFSNRAATLGNFFSDVSNLRDDNVVGVFYPGGGLEGHVGPIGVRFDIADEIYFSSGTHNNLRLSFGPYIRFWLAGFSTAWAHARAPSSRPYRRSPCKQKAFGSRKYLGAKGFFLDLLFLDLFFLVSSFLSFSLPSVLRPQCPLC